MPKEAAHRVTKYVKEKCGDDLRSVVLITEDGWNGIYLREDLKEEYTKTVYGETVELFRPTEETDFSNDVSLPLGIRRASVFCHEEAFILRFRYSKGDFILVSIDPAAGRELLDFIGDCQTIVQGEQ